MDPDWSSPLSLDSSVRGPYEQEPAADYGKQDEAAEMQSHLRKANLDLAVRLHEGGVNYYPRLVHVTEPVKERIKLWLVPEGLFWTERGSTLVIIRNEVT